MALCAMSGVGLCIMHGHIQDALYSGGCCLSCWISSGCFLPFTVAAAVFPQYNACCLLSGCTWGECGRQVRCSQHVIEHAIIDAYPGWVIISRCDSCMHPTSRPHCRPLLPPSSDIQLRHCVSSCFQTQRSYFRKRLEMPGGEYVCSGFLGDFFEVLFCFPLTVLQVLYHIQLGLLTWNNGKPYHAVCLHNDTCIYFNAHLSHVYACTSEHRNYANLRSVRSAVGILYEAFEELVSRS
jgi:hypothetical protein